jgi:Uncharacterised protein family (UPF0158)
MGTRHVAIDWDGLERALTRQSRESEVYLDTRSGDVVYLTRGWSDDHSFTDGELDEGLVSGRLVRIEPLPAETEHGWMTGFADSLPDGWARDGLRRALSERMPTQRFEEALGHFPRERLQWLACRGERVRAVLRTWLVASEVVPTTEPPARLAGVVEGKVARLERVGAAGADPDPAGALEGEAAVSEDRERLSVEGRGKSG